MTSFLVGYIRAPLSAAGHPSFGKQGLLMFFSASQADSDLVNRTEAGVSQQTVMRLAGKEGRSLLGRTDEHQRAHSILPCPA